MGANLGGKVRQASATADALLSSYRDSFCAPATYVPSGKMPANFTCERREGRREGAWSDRGRARADPSPPPPPPAPGFSLTFSMGNCSLGLAAGAAVNCVGPYTRFRMTPAVLTGPYTRPGFFRGEDCAASATFGTTTRRVLAVLDKNAKFAPADVAAAVSGAVSGAVQAALPAVPGVPLTGFVGAAAATSATAAVDGAGGAAAGGSASDGAGGGGASTTAAGGGGGGRGPFGLGR